MPSGAFHTRLERGDKNAGRTQYAVTAYDDGICDLEAGIMVRLFNKFCWPYKKLLGWALIALGAILMLLFIPLTFWLALIGVLLVVLGIFFAKF